MILKKPTNPIQKNIGAALRSSPWIIIGATAILLLVVLVLAIQNTRRDRRHMTQVLSTRGAALIRAVEAGARTGMRGMMWGGTHIQRLLEETSQLPYVRYIAVIAMDGTVLAHSSPDRIGQPLHSHKQITHPGPDFEESWNEVTTDDGRRVFEVHRHFRPLPPDWRRHGGRMGAMMRERHGEERPDDWFDPLQSSQYLIVVGLDPTPFQESIRTDIRNTILLSVILMLLGFAGLVSLFWMQSYRSARRSLQDTSAFADDLVAHLPVGLIATDAYGRMAFFNAAAEQITGLDNASAMGKTPEEILPSHLCDLKTLLDSHHTISEKEMECAFSPDRTTPLSVSAKRILNAKGQLVGQVLILRDLGEVRRLQAEIRRQEKLAALGGLAAGVAHEIRNPLSSIKGLATYFGGKFDPGSEDRKIAQVMTQEVDRLNRVITELLEFARPSDLKYRSVDINALLQRSLQLVQQDASAKGILIEKNLSADLCPVLVDPDRLSQCLLNLYLNAIEAMPSGGLMAVTSDQPDSSHIRMQIADTGKGIAEGDQESIFNPYFTTKNKGTGLGLAIVHKIVQAHQGHIRVHSTPGRGACFELRFPCQKQTQRGNHDD